MINNKNIFITINGKTHVIELNSDDCLHKKIEDKTGIPVEYQQLRFGGKLIDSETSLVNESTIHMTFCLIGGGKKNKRGKIEKRRELSFATECQRYAIIKKKLGGRRAEVDCFDGKNRLGRFRKRGPRMNIGDIVLISLREFQDDKCDIIEKYSTEEIGNLRTYGELPSLSCHDLNFVSGIQKTNIDGSYPEFESDCSFAFVTGKEDSLIIESI